MATNECSRGLQHARTICSGGRRDVFDKESKAQRRDFQHMVVEFEEMEQKVRGDSLVAVEEEVTLG